MSTIQKAFVFIVLVLALLTATVQLVLFAQRDNWRSKYDEVAAQVADARSKMTAAQNELKNVKDNAATKMADMESQLAAKTNELNDTQRQLESALADKTNLASLVSTANAKMEALSQNMESLTAMNEALSKAKDAAEAELLQVKAQAQQAEEQFTIVARKAKDLEAKVASLEEQVQARDKKIKLLAQKVEALSQYAPDVGPSVSVTSEANLFGKVTGLSNDRQTAYISLGKDDGVVDNMVLMIYKADGTYAADAKVYQVGAHKTAARIIKPVRATISEGDYVANK